ncbi:GNAT family N-acetyltransferase [Brucepastera parasyntrophica]|uniref:GNAT family N-acetyltransferase n=1 Tax=Brucepastera parasyntrophica TaxID=2880008 RepID=UPI00210EA062|nr:GNAT family N-acetyltransferase [Brucepastera parasyntrophica]ULQ59026.1 GNAT family N-acetyltransferase [Brucepastera parasyntrophica]
MTIEYALSSDYGWLRKHDRYVADEILKTKIEHREIYVVRDGDEITGWLRYNLFWDHIPFMNMLFLLEQYRNKGTGKKLVQFWEDDMRKKGHDLVLTSTLSDESAQHFYRKLGYVENGALKYRDEALEIIFCRKL